MRTVNLACKIILFLLSFNAIAQVVEEKSSFSSDSVVHQNLFDGKFNHSSNTYYWTGRLNYFYQNDELNLFVNDQLNSTVIKSNRTYIQDIQNLNLKFQQNIANDFKFDFRLNSIVFSDDRSVGINNASINSFLGGIDYYPHSPFSISTLGGWKFDNQIGVKDNGFSYLFKTKVNNYDLGGYITGFDAELNEDYLSPRKNDDKRMYVRIEKDFSKNANEYFNFQYRNFRKDFYISADSEIANLYNVSNNIEQRKEEVVLFNNQINYSFLDYFRILFVTSLSNRNILKQTKYKNIIFPSSNLFDLRINEFKIEGLFQLETDFGSLKNILKFGLNERDEKHTLDYFSGAGQSYYQNRLKAEGSKDNISNTTFLSLNSFYQFSTKDILQFSGMIRILRYDTPSESNFDDRDELLMLAGLSENHVFSPYFNLRNTLDLSSFHTVFLYGEQSANNLTNKIIRLQSQTNYTPSENFRTMNSFEVLANYSVYDFEDKVPSYKSLVFRQFSWIDSTSLEITKNIGLDFFSYLKYYERGELNWKDFKESPVDFLSDNTLSVLFRYNLKQDILIACGYKMFLHYRYRYNKSQKELFLSHKSLGPTCKIIVRFNNYFSLYVDGWYENRWIEENVSFKYANFNLNVLWFF